MILQNIGMEQSKADPCVFRREGDSKLSLFADADYVDREASDFGCRGHFLEIQL